MERLRTTEVVTRVAALWVPIALVSISALWLCLRDSGPAPRAPIAQKPWPHNSEASPVVAAHLSRLPLTFEANHGQTDPAVKFLARGAGYTLFLTSHEALLSFRSVSVSSAGIRSASSALGRLGSLQHKLRRGTVRGGAPATGVLRMEFVGADPQAPATGVDELPARSNYFLGSNPAGWRTGVTSYGKILYRGIYPGVDVVYYGHAGQLEYDLRLAPGADPNSIRLALTGHGLPAAVQRRLLKIDARGDLVGRIAGAELRFHKPQAYQWAAGSKPDGRKQPVEALYAINSSGVISFKLGRYDPSRPVVIDPTLGYSSYLGGSDDDEGNGIAVDRSGNLYMTGQTASLDFPATSGSFQTANAGSDDVFVTKFDSAGQLIYSTYLGGSAFDSGEGVAVDRSGAAYLTGTTCSSDFPTIPGAFQSAYAGTNGGCETYGGDAFVSKLNPSGSTLAYSTYLGSSGSDVGYGIAINASGNAYVAGLAGAASFPTTAGAAQTRFGGGFDAFVSEVGPEGSSLVYSTFVGGQYGDLAYSIALDSSGDAFAGGYTDSKNFPVTSKVFQTTLRAPTAGFVTKLNPQGSKLLYSTYLGGSGSGTAPCATCVTGVALDPLGDAYVSGLTWETNFPVTSGAIQRAYAGGYHDAFVAEFNAAGSALRYATYLGGNGDDGAVSVAVDGTGNIYLRGNTYSTNFPVTSNALQSANGGGSDAFLAEIAAGGKTLLYSTYLGGSGDEFAGATRSLALVGAANPIVYLAGYTNSTNFPVTSGAFQSVYGGGTNDSFVAGFSFAAPRRVPNGERTESGPRAQR
jgi:hypothetical protein